MDNVQGQDNIAADDAYDYGAIEAPPVIGAAERRMHVRAYNYWVSLLGHRAFPSIEDLSPEDVSDFGPNSVLLDFSLGIEDPAIIYLGSALREQCGVTGPVERTSDVPARSLLTRLTDHYLQIIANAAPVGFEAEFTNQRGAEILYRGILMPFSSDNETIDFIYGVVSWKELASQSETDALGAEMAQALRLAPHGASTTPVWADSPSATSDLPDVDFPRSSYDDADSDGEAEEPMLLGSDMIEDAAPAAADEDDFGFDITTEESGQPVDPAATTTLDLTELESEAADGSSDQDADELVLDELMADFDDINDIMDLDVEDILPDDDAGNGGLTLVSAGQTPDIGDVLDVREADDDLDHALDLARQSAIEARETDARSRAALYRAISLAYDFSLAARNRADDYAALLERTGIVATERSPTTAIVKLVFGADYEKTRLAEYALALDYATGEGLRKGDLGRQLAFYQGGLKGLVRDVRIARRQGEVRPTRSLERAKRKLAKAKPIAIVDLPVDEQGMAVVVARREADGSLSILGALAPDDKVAQQTMIAACRK
ncbi:PAS domain-containing protein [Sphingobium subterraneum]|uniref:PAS domain-containing protein n=1 Tax=Sphingobium subterraneum TaxID=627688 RepID=A0A841J7Y2_9SPHN|nr:hypothetical protein [Sphingobium subterraneum]MBB6124635.1 hypothetical protein [Sphingobium subterraneum]